MEKLLKNPNICCKSGISKVKAAKAIAAPEIISYVGGSFLAYLSKSRFKSI